MIAEIKPSIVKKMIDEDIVMIDVRREEEWERTGVIKNAHKLTFFDIYGNHDIENWMKAFTSLVTSKDQVFILICARANRTVTIGNFLIEQGYKNTAHLSGGMQRWQEELKETFKA
jgi:rhodanese-related sulfurtransferase